ncbi:MAG: hypothetical protein IJJ44_04040 [Solobacterium sp.]|nr:hypothetical protein [Solobacterium sp.]
MYKNAFPGFWEHIRIILEKLQTEEGLLELCDTVKFYYYSNSPTDIKNSLTQYLKDYPNSIIASDLLIHQALRNRDWDSILTLMNDTTTHFFFDDVSRFSVLGSAYSNKKEHLIAASYLEKLLERIPDAPDVKNDLGLEYLDGKQYEKALAVFKECMDENRDLPYSPNNYVRTLLKMKNYQEAMDFIQSTQFKISKDLVNRVNKGLKKETSQVEETKINQDSVITEESYEPQGTDSEPDEDVANNQEDALAEETDSHSTEVNPILVEQTDEQNDNSVFWSGGDDPFLKLLDDPDENYIQQIKENKDYASEMAGELMNALQQLGIEAELLSCYSSSPITRYEIRLGKTIRIRDIKNNAADLQMLLNTRFLNIEAPIPGKNAIGIDIPSLHALNIPYKKVMFRTRLLSSSPLTICVGEDLSGTELYFDLNKLDTILISGSTGVEQESFLHATIMSLLINSTPEDVRLVLIDPRRVEFSPYNHAPHLLIPVINNIEMSHIALDFIEKLCDIRRSLFVEAHVKNLDSYNQKTIGEKDKLPHIVVLINYYSEILINDANTVWSKLERILDLSSIVGVHLILSDNFTEAEHLPITINSHMNTKVFFTYLPAAGAKTTPDDSAGKYLMGNGEMIIKISNNLNEYHGIVTTITDPEMNNIVQYTESLYQTKMDEHFIRHMADRGEDPLTYLETVDPLYNDAKQYVVDQQKASTSLLQRYFGIGYNRAARLIDYLLQEGVIIQTRNSSGTSIYVVNESIKEPEVYEQNDIGPNHEDTEEETEILSDIESIPKFTQADILVKFDVTPSKKPDIRYYLNEKQIAPDIVAEIIEQNSHRFFKKKISVRYEMGQDVENLINSNIAVMDMLRNSKGLFLISADKNNLKKLDGFLVPMDNLQYSSCQTENKFYLANYCDGNVLTIHLPYSTIILCPETMYLYENSKFKAIPYKKTHIQLYKKQGIIRDSTVPTGFRTVHYLYEHTNYDGTPDLRYKTNKRYPIIEFIEIEMKVEEKIFTFISSATDSYKTLINVVNKQQ